VIVLASRNAEVEYVLLVCVPRCLIDATVRADYVSYELYRNRLVGCQHVHLSGNADSRAKKVCKREFV